LDVHPLVAQHPQPVIGSGHLDPTMWKVLLFTWAAVSLLFALMVRQRYRLEAVRHETEVLRQELEDRKEAPAATSRA